MGTLSNTSSLADYHLHMVLQLLPVTSLALSLQSPFRILHWLTPLRSLDLLADAGMLHTATYNDDPALVLETLRCLLTVVVLSRGSGSPPYAANHNYKLSLVLDALRCLWISVEHPRGLHNSLSIMTTATYNYDQVWYSDLLLTAHA